MNIPLNDIPSEEWEKRYNDLLKDGFLSKKYDRQRRLEMKMIYVSEFLSELKSGRHNVLDIGPGPGEFLEVCRHYGNSILGIDAPRGESEMGDEYLDLSELMSIRQDIPIRYFGFDTYIRGGSLPFADEEFSVINSQGSIEQVCEDYMDGDKDIKHKSAREISWLEDDKTVSFLTSLFAELKRVVKVSGIIMIYGNGAKNVKFYNNFVRTFCRENGLEIVMSKDKRLHKLRRLK